MIHDEEELSRAYLRPHKRPLGTTHVFYGQGHWPWGCQVGPDWICLGFTFALIWTPSVALLAALASQSSPINFAIVLLSLILVTCSLNGAAFSDPGIIPKCEIVGDDVSLPPTEAGTGHTLCATCNVYRPRGAFHCRDCDCCVADLDHHCPWTGHCIGKGNLRAFHLYLAMLAVHIVIVVVFAMLMVNKIDKHVVL